jgi:hypothetical protein
MDGHPSGLHRQILNPTMVGAVDARRRSPATRTPGRTNPHGPERPLAPIVRRTPNANLHAERPVDFGLHNPFLPVMGDIVPCTKIAEDPVYEYTAKTLMNWSKERGQDRTKSDTSAIMEPIARRLTESQIAAVAAYLTTWSKASTAVHLVSSSSQRSHRSQPCGSDSQRG